MPPGHDISWLRARTAEGVIAHEFPRGFYWGTVPARRLFAIAVYAAGFSVGLPLAAQVPVAPPPAAAQAAPDPLGRESPFGTIAGFSGAVRRNELAVAGRYLQDGKRTPQDTENLARDLSDLLDRYFTQPLTSLSMAPGGDLADGLDPNRERIPLTIGEQRIDLFLTRITDPAAGPIWVFAADSLPSVSELSREATFTWVERVMPTALVARRLLGVSLAQWILWAASMLVPLAVFSVGALVVAWAGRRRIPDVTRRAVFLNWWRGVRWLFVVGLTLLAHLGAMRLLGFSVTFRLVYARIGLTIGVVVAALLVWRLLSVTFNQARSLAMRRGRSDTRSVIQLAERIVKVVVVVTATFILLGIAGVNLTTALAGVGIVGIAVAFGAQRSVENLLGGIFLVTDQALAVGDYCRILDREGWVEDITLRSVRLRTVEQTLLSVPAGLLAQGSIENFASRAKTPIKSVLRLRYGTTGEQLQAVLDGIRQLLIAHRSIDRESARIRLIAFGEQAIELELFAYVTTSDGLQFLEIRESVLMQVAQIVESSGTTFSLPTPFLPRP